MLKEEDIKKIEYSFKHGDSIVIKVGNKVYVADRVFKHRKEATIEFQECYEVDESCFWQGEYFGDTLDKSRTLILADPFADQPNTIATRFYEDELQEII